MAFYNPGYGMQSFLKIATCIDIMRLGIVLSSLSACDVSELKSKVKRALWVLKVLVGLILILTGLQYAY